MSTQELEKYKQIYSEFISELVHLHNAHLVFVNRLGRETGFAVRKHLKEITKLQKELKKSNVAAFNEYRENSESRKLLSVQRREMMKQKIKDGTAKVKQKKNGHNDQSTKDSI